MTKTAKPNDIAIIGMACHFPGAVSLREYWENIVHKRDCITDIPKTHWDPEEYWDSDLKVPDKSYCKRGGFLPFVDFDPMEFGIAPKDLDVIDTAQLLGMKVAREAMRDAGYGQGKPFPRDRTSAIVGTTSITELATPLNMRLAYPTMEKILRKHGVAEDVISSVSQQYSDSFPIWQENSFPGVLGNVISGRVANTLDLGGTNCVIDAACASALGAVKMSIDALLARTSDMVVTGGVDTVNNIFMYLCFSKTPAFSKEGKSRPFDHKSDGILIGEGLGLVVLKRYEDALRDGDRVYAVIRSIGSSSDGRAKSIYQPLSSGQQKALIQAYELAEVHPRSIDLLEAHGTGTPVGDLAEVTALKSVYAADSADPQWCALGSVKSQIGHTKASAGIAGLMKAALALHHKILPPTINVEEPNPKMELHKSSFYVNSEIRPWLKPQGNPRRAACRAFGFGGTNFHVVLEEHTDTCTESIYQPGAEELFVFQADDAAGLATVLQKVLDQMPQIDDFHQFARHNQHLFEKSRKVTLTLVCKSIADLMALLTEARNHLIQTPLNSLNKKGLFYFPQSGKPDAKLALAFPGQGAQYVGMGRELLLAFPFVHQILEEFEEIRKSQGLTPLTSVLYPITAYSPEDKQTQEELLRRTDMAQAALAFVNVATFEVLQKLGLKAEYTCGHSFGELTALYAAGVIDRKDYFRLAISRGQLMAECAAESSGTMAAVLAPIAKIEAALKQANSSLKTEVVLANYNAPEQGVISGRTKDVEAVSAALAKAGLNVRPIAVSAAFHTSLMAPAVKKFGDEIQKIKMSKPQGKVFSNMSGKAYPQDSGQVAACLRDQLLYPVRFTDLVSNMVSEGVDMFIECGPSKILTGLVQRITDSKDSVLTLDSMTKGEPSLQGLLSAVARLMALGRLDFQAAAFGQKPDSLVLKPKLSPVTVKLNGANYLKQETRDAKNRDAKVKVAAPVAPVVRPSVSSPVSQSVPVPTVAKTPPAVPVPAQSSPRLAAPVFTNPSSITSSQAHVTPKAPGKPMNQENPNQMPMNPTSLDELQRYRMRMVEVQEQFLQMQMEANRLMERMLAGGVTLSAPAPVMQPMYQAPMPPAPMHHAHVPMPPAPMHHPPVHHAPPPAPMHHAPMPTPQAAMPVPPAPSVPAARAVQKPGSVLGSVFEKRPAQPVKPVAAAPVAAASSSQADQIQKFLMATIAEKTGFPVDMLNADMDLENDLAVDSIRRVEILGAVQEKFPQAPTIGPSQLGVLKTIRDIVTFLGGSAATAPVAATPAAAPAASAKASGGSMEIQNFLMSVIAEKTGFPMDMLNADMDLENDLAVDSIRRVEILGAVQEKFPQAPSIGPAQLGTLKTIADITRYLGGSDAQANAGAAVASATVAPAASGAALEMTKALMTIIADKTGFPPDMLNADMDLENDLAVDSIRRVEILGAMQEKFPQAPSIGPAQLGTIRTIGDVISYLSGSDASAAVGEQKKKI